MAAVFPQYGTRWGPGPITSLGVEIMSALFVEQFEMRQALGGSARLDLTGVYYSMAAPGPFPVSFNPHLLVLVRCPEEHQGLAALEVVFMRDGEQIARNVQPLSVEPGKFGYNLVQAELEFASPASVIAQCRIDGGPVTSIPLSVGPPVED